MNLFEKILKEAMSTARHDAATKKAFDIGRKVMRMLNDFKTKHPNVIKPEEGEDYISFFKEEDYVRAKHIIVDKKVIWTYDSCRLDFEIYYDGDFVGAHIDIPIEGDNKFKILGSSYSKNMRHVPLKTKADWKAFLPGKLPAKEKKSLDLLKQIESDMKSFRPGGEHGNTTINRNGVTKDFRHLGNWVHDEENSWDREEDDENWREDNDQMIWGQGEYKRYFKVFKDWVANKPWKNKVLIDLETSEKNWCYFHVTLKK